MIPAVVTPTLLFYLRPLPPVPAPGHGEGAKLLSIDDERWKRCWIKTIALLPNILAKTQAVSRGYDEAVFVDEGRVTECSASNLFIVTGGKLVTHPVGPRVLPGITRSLLLQGAERHGNPVEERPITEAEALAAPEIFITSTTREVSWVGEWNDQPAGSSRCGPITLALHAPRCRSRVRKETFHATPSRPLAQTA